MADDKFTAYRSQLLEPERKSRIHAPKKEGSLVKGGKRETPDFLTLREVVITINSRRLATVFQEPG